MIDKPFIPVTKPYLPPKEEYQAYLDRIWQTTMLSNNGPLVQELEAKLREYLGVKHVLFMSNGTIALQLAIRALDIKKEIITTPFSYVATTTSIIWEGCTPVFVDIDPKTLCIDPEKIEAAITPCTEAIMAVHVYGVPCAVERIERIAKKYNLKVIYDAAHAFGIGYEGQSILNWGDISTLSFHATKLYHTVEGGAVVTNNDEIAKKVSLLRSFGYVGDEYYIAGINGKNTEFHAAMGLSNLPHVAEIKEKRKIVTQMYDEAFALSIKASTIRKPTMPESTIYNYIYYPLVFSSKQILEDIMADLSTQNIFARRYFYPSLNTLTYLTPQSCPVSESMSQRALCLPLYDSLSLETVKMIITICNKHLSKYYEKTI